MSINNISAAYYKALSSLAAKSAEAEGTTETTTENSTTASTDSKKDSVELGSYAYDLSSYLNYNASASYNNMPSLVDFLDEDSQNDVVEGILGTDGTTGVFGLENDNDSDGILSAFEDIADTKTEEIDNLISKVLSKMSQSDADSADKDSAE